MPFGASLDPEQYKKCKTIVAPKVRTDCKCPNYYNLRIRMGQNSSVHVNDKTTQKFSPITSGDSLLFNVRVLVYHSLLM